MDENQNTLVIVSEWRFGRAGFRRTQDGRFQFRLDGSDAWIGDYAEIRDAALAAQVLWAQTHPISAQVQVHHRKPA